MVDVLIALQTWQAQNTPLTKLVTGLLLTRSVISVTPHDTGVESVSVVDTIQYQRILYNQLLSTVLSLNFEEKKTVVPLKSRGAYISEIGDVIGRVAIGP